MPASPPAATTTPATPEIRRRISKRPAIDCDLHMHTDHSNDCATPVEVLLETAKDRGMGAIAVTDHNEISGALAAREAAERDGDIKVIVGEEVKTAEQGEVIGLFLEEKIERGMTMAETIAEIRRQGGLVYVPTRSIACTRCPTTSTCSTWSRRSTSSRSSIRASPSAASTRRPSASPPSTGSCPAPAPTATSRRRSAASASACTTSTAPEEFLEAMRSADIVRKHKNLVYVQALKWMQAASRPGRRPQAGFEPAAGAGRAPAGGEAGAFEGQGRRGGAQQELIHGRITACNQKESEAGRQNHPSPCLPPKTRSRRSTWSGRSAS